MATYDGVPAQTVVRPRIGLVGLMENVQLVRTSIPGVAHDRIDCGDGVTSWAGSVPQLVAAASAAGVTPLPIYNPRPFALDTVKFTALCETCRAHGVTVVEFGNEVFYAGMTAVEYAAEYQAAMPVAAAHGIKLLFCCTGDYDTGSGWSQVEAGKGWLVDAVAAMGGKIPKAIAVHPYGSPFACGVLGGGNPSGLGSVLTMQAWHRHAFGANAPAQWITEYGVTAPGECSEQDQAQTAAMFVQLAADLSFVAAGYWFAVQDGGEGNYGLFNGLWGAKLAAEGFRRGMERAGL